MRSQAVGDATANCPVQELVDAFPMKDGTPYVKSNPETNPYDYRDPRLRETVVWNGDTYGPRKEKYTHLFLNLPTLILLCIILMESILINRRQVQDII